MPTPAQGAFRRALLYSAAGWIGLGVLRTVVRVAMIPRPLDAAALALLRALVVLVPWIVATPLLLRLANALPWTRGRRRRTLLTHAGVALALWLVDATWGWFMLEWTGTPLFVGFRPFVVAQLEQTAFIYAAVVALAAGARHARRYHASSLVAARLEARLLEARVHVLALQLQPHFLFNTLNAVTELVHRDTEAARRVLRSLRELLGRALDGETAQEVPLRHELALLDSYVQIQRIRFAGSLSVEVDAAPDTLDALVPRLVIQPLVENAIRHGTSRRTGPGIIAVRARRDGERILLEVKDDGVGLPARGVREGLGLGNTRERLAQLYGDGFHLSLEPGAERGSVARLEVPRRIEERTVSTVGAEDETTVPAGERPVAIHVGFAVWPLLLVSGWIALGLVGAHEDLLFMWLAGEPLSYLPIVGERMVEAALWIGLTPLVVRFARHLARSDLGRTAVIASHLAAAVAVAFGHMLGLGALAAAGEADPGLAVVRVLTNLCIYAALAGATHAWTLRTLAAERALEAARLEGELAGTRLDALRWQLQPEFLLAALDAISRLCERHPSKAEELTARLGDLLRTLLGSIGSDTAPLASEVAFLEAYVAIERATGATDVALDVRLAPGTESAVVPVRLLQPMAAIVGRCAARAAISLRAERRGAELQVVVQGGVGMGADGDLQARRLRERLERLYGGEARVETTTTAAKATVTVRLPWRENVEAGLAVARKAGAA